MNIIYKLTKIGKVEKPYHKNSTFGESREFHTGYMYSKPKIGERFRLTPYNDNTGISTSPVTEIIDETTFHTLNSIYKLEKVENIDDIF